MEITPENFKQWLDVLGTPTLGVIAFVVLILYREAVIHWIKMFADVLGSWIKRK